AGATLVGVNPTRRGPELTADIQHTDCQLLVADAAGAALLDDAPPAVDPSRVLRVGSAAYESAVAGFAGAPRPSKEPDPAALLLLLFTSGSTGRPKAVRCTQGRLARIGELSVERFEFRRDDVCYCPMPMFHGNAIMAVWAPALTIGAAFATRPRFSAPGF